MPILHNSVIPAAADSTPAEDPVTRSLRLDDGSSPYLVRAASDIGSPTDAKKVTVAFWFKLGNIVASRRVLVGATNSAGTDFWWIELDASHRVNFMVNNGSSSVQGRYITNRVFRDPSAWYHVCFSCDSTAAEADRAIIYVNGVRETSFSTTNHWPADWLNEFNEGTYSQYIGSFIGGSMYFDGLIADVYNIDGQQLEPTDFIELGDYGNYIPKAYTGSFGTNGFHLDAQPLGSDADLLVTSIDRNDGDTTFADVAAGHGLTVSGDTEHSIAVGNPFTSTGRAIDFGTNDSNYLKIWDGSTGDYNLGSDDFTMEAWYNTNDTKSYMTLFSHYQDANNWFCLYVYTNDYLYWYWETGGTYIQIASNVQWKHHKWNHVAVTKSGTTHKLWLNGVQVATGTKGGSHTFTSTKPMYLGTLQGYGSYYHGDGYVYDARISSSIRYTSDFDVPTEKFTDDSDTELLLQPDNSDSDWDDVDKSHNSHDVTEYGTVTRTASTPYEAAAKSTAIHFDGSGDYITTSWDSASDFDFGSSDYTIECWFTVDNTSTTYKTLFGGTAFELNCFVYGTRVLFYGAAGYYMYGPYTISTDTWYHVACQRNGNTLELYFDGSLADTVSWSGTHTSFTGSTPFRIGYLNGYGRTHSGYIYDFRVTKGEAKYSGSTYDTPTAPFELNPVYLGGDQSGNKNHLTPTGISQAHDVLLDNPFKNHPTWNPLVNSSNTFSEGNLKVTTTSSTPAKMVSTIGASSGKWYAELLHAGQDNFPLGITADNRERNYLGNSDGNTSIAFWCGTTATSLYINDSSVTWSGSGTTWASGDIIGIALNADDKEVSLYKNGSLVGAAVSYSSYNWSEAFFAAGNYISGLVYHANFGQDPTFTGGYTGTPASSEWAYSPPNDSSGNPFKSLNTSNLDAPAVKPAENFDAITYTGSGSTRNITGLDFQPDLVWIKDRTTGGSGGFHCIHDSVRGDDGTHKYILSSDNTITTDTTYSGYGVTSFNSDGFSIINGGSLSNDSSRNYVAWNWKAHQSPSSGSSSTTTYTVKVEDNSGDAWDYSGYYYDYSTYLPSVYMEIFENRNNSLVSLGKVAVRYYDSSGNSMSDTSEQTYTLECADLDAIAVKWHYDTSGDGQEWDYPNSYNDYLNDQKITILDGTTSEWTINNHSNDDGTSSNYSPPTGWADGDTLKSATTSYNGSDTATLTSGSGSSGPTEKYNAAAGFTIISYSGDGYTDGDTQTLDHSLGVPLEFVIAKARTNNQSMGSSWVVWHKDLSDYEFLLLNSNSAKKTDYNSYELIDTDTSGSQHQVVVSNGYDGSDYHYLNMGEYSGSSAEDYILYGFAGVEGYSKFGKVTGNGDSSDGVFCYLGFRPALIIMKNITHSSGYHWRMWDSARGSHNVNDEVVYPSLSNAETTSDGHMDFLSNGFKLRSSAGNLSSDYIYAAFAETPFSKANAR